MSKFYHFFSFATIAFFVVGITSCNEDSDLSPDKKEGIPVTLVYNGKEYREFTNFSDDPISIFETPISSFESKEIQNLLSRDEFAIHVPYGESNTFYLFDSTDDLRKYYNLSGGNLENAKMNTEYTSSELWVYDYSGYTGDYYNWDFYGTLHYQVRYQTLYQFGTNWDNKISSFDLDVASNGHHIVYIIFAENTDLGGNSVSYSGEPGTGVAHGNLPAFINNKISSLQIFYGYLPS